MGNGNDERTGCNAIMIASQVHDVSVLVEDSTIHSFKVVDPNTPGYRLEDDIIIRFEGLSK